MHVRSKLQEAYSLPLELRAGGLLLGAKEGTSRADRLRNQVMVEACQPVDIPEIKCSKHEA